MASRSFPRFVEEELGKFPHFVVCAVLEWVLIILLFLDGFLAFAANEFARFFELQTPCLLCTRLDHVLVLRNPDFYYNDSICESHKKHVSSLAFCHNHQKLSDIRKMCENCLLSFATEKQSDCDTYKSLVGILHKDMECFVEDDQQIQLSLIDDDGMPAEKSSTLRCSCCGGPLKVKSSYPKGKHLGPITQAPAPSPHAHPYSTSKNDESRGLELSHARYAELKLSAENESEIAEDEAGSHLNNHDTKLRDDAKAASVPLLTEPDHFNDDANRTPNFIRGNKFFGIPLDSATNSPRISYRFNKKSTLEKTEFASDSHDLGIHHEADDIFYHLKRRVRLDRKSLLSLYMELDEERNASAVAANNAMAMITRLQAEKAAMQMEALQYQRMMEEQAEYDEEALEATHEMLLKREDEIKGLESELEIYRGKYGSLAEDDLKYLKEEIHGYSNEWDDDNVEGKLSESLKDIMEERPHLYGRMKKLGSKNYSAENGTRTTEFCSGSVNNVDNETEKESEASLTGELCSLNEKLKALEADSDFLELVSKEYEQNTEETRILSEISEHLENLRHLVVTNSDGDDQ